MNKFLRGDSEWVEVDFDVEYEVKFEVEDFIFPKEDDRRGSKVEKLPEGSLMDDLEYFSKKVWTSTAIPPQYLSKKFMYEHFGFELPSFRSLVTEEDMAKINYDRAMKVVDAY